MVTYPSTNPAGPSLTSELVCLPLLFLAKIFSQTPPSPPTDFILSIFFLYPRFASYCEYRISSTIMTPLFAFFLFLFGCTNVLRMHVCMYVRMYLYMYVRTYVRIYVCMYVCTCICVFDVCKPTEFGNSYKNLL